MSPRMWYSPCRLGLYRILGHKLRSYILYIGPISILYILHIYNYIYNYNYVYILYIKLYNKNKIVKITNLVFSTVARIYQLVGCSVYIHLIPQILCTIIVECFKVLSTRISCQRFSIIYAEVHTCNCICPSKGFVNSSIPFNTWCTLCLSNIIVTSSMTIDKLIIIEIHAIPCNCIY